VPALFAILIPATLTAAVPNATVTVPAKVEKNTGTLPRLSIGERARRHFIDTKTILPRDVPPGKQVALRVSAANLRPWHLQSRAGPAGGAISGSASRAAAARLPYARVRRQRGLAGTGPQPGSHQHDDREGAQLHGTTIPDGTVLAGGQVSDKRLVSLFNDGKSNWGFQLQPGPMRQRFRIQQTAPASSPPPYALVSLNPAQGNHRPEALNV